MAKKINDVIKKTNKVIIKCKNKEWFEELLSKN